MIGTVVGNYAILDQIAVGGMGTIFRAQHTLIGRIAAIKVLHPELSTNRDIVNRFFNEAKSTSSIKHPGIVEIFDFGYMQSGHAFLVMEFLEGATLSDHIKQRGPMPEGEAALFLRGAVGALAAAHARGIVHRDLKPDNIFLVPDAESPIGLRVKLLDFGIAKLTDIGAAGSATKTGAVMGTPTYMSPEQCKGTGDVDHRADLYSIGCMYYELVSGRPPFVNFGAGELIGSHLFVQPERVSQHAQVTPGTEALIMTLLEKDPARRVQTARELADLLSEIAGRDYGGVAPTFSRPMTAQHGTPTPSRFTPQFTPAPAQYTPAPAYPTPIHQAPTAILQDPKPTTLSGAASVVMNAPPRRGKRGVVIAIGLVAGIAIGAVAVVTLRGGGDSHAASEPPTTVETAKPEPPKPEPPKPVEAKPVEPPKPADTKPADTKPVDTKPADTKPADTKPVDTKPVDTKKPTIAVKPPVKPPVKPTKPTKPAKPTKDPLLETDL